jgi:hypothetical protein
MSELEQKIEVELELMRAKLHKRGPHAKHFAQSLKEEHIVKTQQETSTGNSKTVILASYFYKKN